MKLLSQILFWTGIASIPFSWIMWHIGTNIELGLTTMGPGLTPLLSGKELISNIDDEALRLVLREAHAERWGIFVGLWPVTLLVLSYIIGEKAKQLSQ
jgi:hypothetical protein